MRILYSLALVAFLVSGCASTSDKVLQKTEEAAAFTESRLYKDKIVAANKLGSVENRAYSRPPRINSDLGRGESPQNTDSVSTITRRQVPGLSSSSGASSQTDDFPDLPDRRIEVTIPAQTLPEFVNTVFGDLLGLSFVLGDAIKNSSDVVALRSAPNISSRELFDVALNALSDYGVGAYYEEEVLYIVQYDDLKRKIPRFITARARSSVPAGLRPVVQYVNLKSAEANKLGTLLKNTFSSDQVTINSNPGNNSLTIAGLPTDVDAALEIVDTMDIPQFAGTEVVTIRPQHWEAGDLARQMVEIFNIEGYSISTTPTLARNISLLPIPYTNQISIFVNDKELRAHVVETAMRLDRDAAPQTNKNVSDTHIYRAKYYDAEELARIVDAVLANMRDETPQLSSASTGGGGANVSLSPGAEQRGVSLSGRVIVEKQGNRIVFFGTSEEFKSIQNLLSAIDTPADEVLLEVTIAEVTLNEETKTGLDFLFEQLGSKGYVVGTQGGIGLATGGLTGSITSGDFSLNFGALATNTQINVLSEPRIVTKSGAQASINVGNEVPIITSQRASNAQSGGSTDILQSVQYRSTGIILDMEPIVFSDYRIDLTISQEVSAAEANPNQAIASPIISNRSLSTELSLRDGQSAILGGLMETRFTRGQNGVPFVKDVPILGRAFKTDSLKSDKTMLLVMVTPYILREPEDKLRKLEEMRSGINTSFYENMYNTASTLYGPREELEVGGTRRNPGIQ